MHKPNRPIPDSVAYFRYKPKSGNTSGIHRFALDTETKLIRAEACAEMAERLKQQGFQPDIICGHTGWGETLFLKDVFPDVPILGYQEFFYNNQGFDSNFDPEFSGPVTWENRARTRSKNASQLLGLYSSDWGVTPTYFQRSSFPAAFQDRISVIHDGIDVDRISRVDHSRPLDLSDSLQLHSGQQIITFVNRRIEPYRGCHTFLRALPRIHRMHPDAHVVVVGALTGVSYGAKCPSGEWVNYFLDEIKGDYDSARLHLVGALSYENFLHLLALSKAHVYLTYPFVLSWSLLEAMAAGCAIVASQTSPVLEVIKDRYNGLLVDFFDPLHLADAVGEILAEPSFAKQLGRQASKDVRQNYSLKTCLPRQLALIDLVASRALL